jgi:hypothetical protein
MAKYWLKLVLAVLVVAIAATAADARRRGYYRGFYAGQEDGEERDRRGEAQERDRRGEAEQRLPQMPQMQRSPTASFGAIVGELTRGCGQQAAEFRAWPFERIAETVSPEAEQRRALDALRDTAMATADTLAAACPPAALPAPASGRREAGETKAESREAPTQTLAARLDAAERAVEAVTAALAAMQPAVRDFYATLDDEQKARLYRGLAAGDAAAIERAPERRRSRAAAESAGVPWEGLCERLTPALREWPSKGIERAMRLSDAQRVALYELYAAALKAADALTSACPAETALTPARRMEVLRTRLGAVRATTTAIRPALMRFHDALDGAQQQRFAQMN